jgi:hypothetical protein
MNHRQSAELKVKHELHEFLLIFSLNKSNEIAINATRREQALITESPVYRVRRNLDDSIGREVEPSQEV